MKLKKTLLSVGSLALLATPVFVATSCGGKKEASSLSDIGGLNDYFGNYYEEIQDIANDIKNGDDQNDKNLLFNQKIIQITSEKGVVNDNSFNQMTWEAISKFSEITGISSDNRTYIEDKGNPVSAAYDRALKNDYKIWVLTGWGHEDHFKDWIKTSDNKSQLIDKNIKIIAIDWDASQYFTEDEKGHVISLNFRTQESSFIIGYGISKFLAENYSDNPNKRIINTSSGADRLGSTNFNYGFLEGIRAWNAKQTDDNKKVKINIHNNEKKVWLETTYEANAEAARSNFQYSIKGNGQNVFKGPAPTFAMPVAGDWSKVAADIIKNTGNKNEQWVIGVDSDMSKSYGKNYQDYFATSSEKRIGIVTFKALLFLAGITNKANDNSKATLSLDNTTNASLDSDGKILISSQLNNWSVIGGLKEGFVGASKSTISDPDKAEQLDLFIDEAWTEFFGKNGTQGSLYNNLNERKQQYNTALETNDIYELNRTIFEINNVLACSMTENNQGYFNLIADAINNWGGNNSSSSRKNK